MNSKIVAASLIGSCAVYFAASCGQHSPERRLTAADAGGPLSTVRDAAAQTTSGARLRARHLVADDGAKLFIGFYDSDRNETCGFQFAPDGKMRCMPEAIFANIATTYGNPNGQGTARARFFADAACTAKLGWVQNAPCPVPTPAFIVDAAVFDACHAEQKRYFAVGDPHVGAVYYSDNATGGCGRLTSTITTGAQIYSIGPEIPADAWAVYEAAAEQRE